VTQARQGDPVADVVADVARRLRGPRRLRRDLLAELRDGLEDAGAGHRAAGAAEPRRARAVAEFGSAAEVAAACQRELTAVQARRTAVAVCVAAPGVQLLWHTWYPALAAGSGPAARPAAASGDLSTVESVIVWLVAAAALHQVMLLSRGRGVAAARVVAALSVGLVLVVGVLSVLMTTLDDGATVAALRASPQGWALGLVSVVMLGGLGGLAWRTAVVTRHAARIA
jgi:hypothetical protein